MDRTIDAEGTDQRTTPTSSASMASAKTLFARVANSANLGQREKEKLRRIIEGTVASMTAQKMSSRFETGLEHDRLYERALADFRDLVLRPGTRLPALRAFLDTQLPPSRPDHVKVLFLEAVARRLGRDWTEDACDFIDVTIAAARLQEVVQALSLDYRGWAAGTPMPFAVIMTPYGEQHTLMPHLLGLLFDTLGWSRRIIEPRLARGPMLIEAVRRADVACIGWSNARLAEEMRALVLTIRQVRDDRRLPLIIGGAAALESIDLLVELGVDCICDSVYAAARICESYHELNKLSLQARTGGQTAVVKAGGIDWLSP